MSGVGSGPPWDGAPEAALRLVQTLHGDDAETAAILPGRWQLTAPVRRLWRVPPRRGGAGSIAVHWATIVLHAASPSPPLVRCTSLGHVNLGGLLFRGSVFYLFSEERRLQSVRECRTLFFCVFFIVERSETHHKFDAIWLETLHEIMIHICP